MKGIDFNAGIILETLNNKVDLPTEPERSQDQIDYVIDKLDPTSENNYTWYRKYKSGWVEQGGITTTNTTVILPIEMQSTNYVLLAGSRNTSQAHGIRLDKISATSFYINSSASADHSLSWSVSGYAL